ncbi:MAG: ribosome biogenesis GTPase Der [Bacteroidetes bacterium]|nr:ribosome biogenesis GTPase Der [Bacteroidota bacterium]MBU1720158.1 ribosome biogenesis GTPase Der [Bacteroidota bacterium]
MPQIVAIVGRPNVGKSTLFNRFTETVEAIVDQESGVTRDRHYGKVIWNGREFSIIDTGGYVMGSDDVFEEEICRQVELAIDEANMILFVLDLREGITGMDDDIARMLRKSKKKIFVVVNKVDAPSKTHEAGSFYSLGLGEVFPISSMNGSGTGELLDAMTGEMEIEEIPGDDGLPKFCVVGRPNVGKSSFINVLMETDRHIVTPVAGTTRDSLFSRYSKFGMDFNLVDTAGIRKKSKVHEDIEFYSVIRSIRAIESSDVCLLMIDAKDGLEGQDLNIFSLAVRNKKGVVILVNKWDLVEKETNTSLEFEKRIREKISPFTDVPIVFVSALTKQRIHKALETAIMVYKNRSNRIKTSELNEVMLPVIEAYPPPAYKGKFIRIKFITQLPTPFPSFAFFCNLPQYIREPYRRYVENKLREKFDFLGVPVIVYFRQK